MATTRIVTFMGIMLVPAVIFAILIFANANLEHILADENPAVETVQLGKLISQHQGDVRTNRYTRSK